MGSHVSHEQETKDLKCEIDHLCKMLRRREHDRRNSISPSSEESGEHKHSQRVCMRVLSPRDLL